MSVALRILNLPPESALKGVRAAALAALAALSGSGLADAAQPGEAIENTATISYTVGGGPAQTLDTNTASFTVLPVPTDSTIALRRHLPAGFGGSATTVRPTDFSTGGGFSQVAAPVAIAADLGDGEATAQLSDATGYSSGETAYIQVTDAGQNLNDGVIDTIDVVVTDDDTGDQETLRLRETEPDSGVFVGFIGLVTTGAVLGDGELSIVDGSTITATYTDPFDATDISSSSALIDPFGVVFDSGTGALIDGVEVTLLDSGGNPATVYAPDGVTLYPSTVTTGALVTDAGGGAYPLAPGEFRFPLVAAGDYRLEVTPTNGYVFPSTIGDAALQALPGGPFALNAGSRGGLFSVTGPGPVSVDVPVDRDAEVFLTKSASESVTAEGEFLKYELELQNDSDVDGANVFIEDRLPAGFRFQPGSLRLDGDRAADPQIGGGGRLLRIDVGDLAQDESVTVSYVVEVTVLAPAGEAVNTAAAFGDGAFASNRTSAVVQVQEELFRSRSFILGRVSVNACDPNEAWPREIKPGLSLEGARIFLETGEYVVTDENGEYHFQDVAPRPHVVQLDVDSLPAGYEPVMCEENIRAAGSAISRFVDPKGGQIERVDFHLRYTGAPQQGGEGDSDGVAPDAENGAGEEAASEERAAEIAPEDLDAAWLMRQSPKFDVVYPREGESVASPNLAIGVLTPKGGRIKVWLNGEEVSSLNRRESITAAGALTSLQRWAGVDLEDGTNRLEVAFNDAEGVEIERVTRTVYYVEEATRAEYLPERSVRVADGKTPPIIALRLTDRAGRPVRQGLRVEASVEPPYEFREVRERLASDPLTEVDATVAQAVVGPDGVLELELEPTFTSGVAHVRVTLADEQETFQAFIKPGNREWIVVGLAEGTAGFNTVSGNMENYETAGGEDEAFTDGRLAFYAKGMIKGEWLLTIAVDTAKRRGDVDDQVFEDIDPDAYYPVYGDASERGHDAQSQYPLYLKLEREQFFALFGDFETGLDETQLGRYERRFSGLKTVYEGEQFSVIAFGSETNQGFVTDELPSDGTTGPYELSRSPIVVGSETIRVETRDRFNAEVVLETTPLSRFLDYEIDYLTGEIFLRRPIATTDASLNPNFLVVEYDAEQDLERGFNYGGRVEGRFMDGRVEVGATYLHEDDAAAEEARTSDLAAADVTIALRKDTELRLEAGVSRNKNDDESATASAFLAELEHESEFLNVTARFRQEDAGYGVGQTPDATGGVRRMGVSGAYRISERVDDEGTGPLPALGWRTEFSAEREEDLDTNANRMRGEAFLVADNKDGETRLGARTVRDELSDGTVERSDQLIVSTEQAIWDNRIRLFVTREQTLNNSESEAFPTRTLTGAEVRVTDWISLVGLYEASERDDATGDAIRLGVETQPWEGGRVSAYGDRVTGESSEQLMATLGVGQVVRIDENWSASVGFERQQVLDSSGEAETGEERIFGETRPMENFTLGYLGAGYTDADWSLTSRIELRDGAEEDRLIFSLGAYGDVTDAFAVSAAMRMLFRDFDETGLRQEIDADFGFAYRPIGGDVIWLNKLTFGHSDGDTELEGSEARRTKIVNNMAVNWRMNPQTELTANVGGKYVISEIDGDDYSGASALAGLSGRYDLTERWSLGAQGAVLLSENSGLAETSAGLLLGFSPIDNLALDLGYNFIGFEDRDFPDAEYTAQGAFVRVRFKFDQNTLSDVLKEIR